MIGLLHEVNDDEVRRNMIRIGQLIPQSVLRPQSDTILPSYSTSSLLEIQSVRIPASYKQDDKPLQLCTVNPLSCEMMKGIPKQMLELNLKREYGYSTCVSF